MFDDVSAVSHTSPQAKISGVLHSISPMKKTRTSAFFECLLTDANLIFGLTGSIAVLVESS